MCKHNNGSKIHLSIKKNERLKSRKSINLLFSESKQIKKFPIKLLWTEQKLNTTTNLQITFSVPKRKFKLAVDRNRIKRQMKEAYRLNCKELKTTLDERNYQIICMIIFIDKYKPTYKALEIAIQKALTQLNQELNS